jgi:hypothetical protein
MSEKIEKMAQQMVGDGKKPNKFFVTISNGYSYVHGGDIDYIGDIIKDFESKFLKYETVAVFDTLRDAIDEAEGYFNTDVGRFRVNTVTVEDRLFGEVWRKEKVLDVGNAVFFEEEYKS